jgi:HEAT repeat protein
MSSVRSAIVALVIAAAVGGCVDRPSPILYRLDLESSDASRRQRALLALAQVGGPEGRKHADLLPLLHARAKDRGDPLREMYFDALVHLRAMQVRDPQGDEFSALMVDESEPVAIRLKAVEMVDARSAAGEAVLARMVESSTVPIPVRVAAVRALGAGCRSAADVLRPRIGDDPVMQAAAFEALASLGDYAAVTAALSPRADGPEAFDFSALLRDPVYRQMTLERLAATGVPAVPALVAALGSPDEALRMGAASALGRVRWGAKAAIPALAKVAAGDPSPHARKAAADALREIGPSLAELGESLAPGPDEEARVRAMARLHLALSQMGEQGAEAVAPLRAVLADPSPKIRADAISALPLIGAPAVVAVPEILGHLRRDEIAWVRSAAALALGPLHNATSDQRIRADIVKALEAADDDGDGDVERCAAQSLRQARSGPQRRPPSCGVAQ